MIWVRIMMPSVRQKPPETRCQDLRRESTTPRRSSTAAAGASSSRVVTKKA